MFLSRFRINSARRGAVKLLASPQAMHAAVLAGFSHDTVSEIGRVLWRVDRDEHRATLYVVSPGEPDFTHLVEQAGWPATESWTSRAYDGLLESLARGQTWGFRLTANPTKATRLPQRTRSQRVGHVTAAQQRQWLLDRAGAIGADFVEEQGDPLVFVRARTTESFRRQDRRVTLARATFDGCLTVVDPDRLRTVLTAGLGPAKAYGCGLMTLARATGGE